MNRQERASRAEQLMNDPLVIEFFDNYKSMLFNRWLASQDEEERAKLYSYAVCADAFRVQMKSHMASGRVEEENA